MAAEIATSVQQRPSGTELMSEGAGDSVAAMRTGGTGGPIGVAVRVTSGCVLLMVIGFGGSGRTLMRAVSFFG